MKRSSRTRQRRQQDRGGIHRLLVAAIMICLLGLARSVPLADVEPTTDAEVDLGLGATPELNDASDDDGNVFAASSSMMAEPATGAKAAAKALAVCQGEPANALHPDPDDCHSFITCDGHGSGSRTLCAAGTGYSSDKQSCLPLTAGPEGATAADCVFAAAAVEGDADAQVQASSAAETGGVISLTCSDALLQDKAVTATNLDIVAGSPEFGGAARCALANLGRQGRLVFQIDPADQRVISTLTISYFQRGQGGNMLQVISAGATAGARKNTKQVLSSLVPAAAGGGEFATASASDGNLPLAAQPWVRGIQRISLPSLPTSVGVVLLQQDRDVAEVQLLSVTLTTTTAPPANIGPVPASATAASATAAAATAAGPDATKQQAADGTWVAPTPEEVQSYAASTLLDSVKPSGRKLLQTEVNWLVSLPMSDPDLLGGSNDQSLLDTFLGSWQRINTPSQCYRPTYGRGVGEPVSVCGDGQEKQAGLCYNLCKPGYTGVGPVCWEKCPSGYRDDGVTCYKGGDTAKASGKCPGYDLCGMWKKNRNCKTCPPEFDRRDGCLCTRYPKWHTKDTYTRAPHMPGCGGSKPDYDAGLCYPTCALGYSGVGPVCWANCADSEPVYCGASKASSAICSRDQQACNNFIAKVIIQVVSLVVEVAKAVAEVVGSAGTLSATAVMGIIQKGAAIATTFAETPMCDKVARLHLPSGLTLLEFDRDFAGFDVTSLQSPSYTDCMVQCANNPACEFAVYGAKWQACWLKRSPGSGPNGVNAYNPELKTGVAIQRVKTDRANFQWSKAADADLAGSLILVGGSDGGYGITHSNVPGQRNLALCAVTCMTLQGCTHVVYTDTTCFFKNANEAPQTTPATGGQIRGTLVNMSVLNFDKK